MRRRFDGFEEDTRRYRRPRLIDDDHVGFRLLDPSANVHHQYYLDIPEPPRAPEPYKISGASSSMTRAHRRSSFVILADAIEPTSRSVGGSPTHEQRIIRSPLSPTRVIPGGRSSPFRPRGFKGPLPHAQSRPQSPPVPARRFIQPKSLSQGNSPRKQSLIPQPRGGLTSHRSNQKNKDRDRWERRSGRYVTRIPRTSSLKFPSKRPVGETIRGTRPSTKMTVKNNTTNGKIGGTGKAGAPGKVNGNSVGKSTDKKINRSPTKIPVRYSAFVSGGVASNNGGGGERFIKIPDNNNDNKKDINSPTVSSESSSVPATTTDESVVIGSAETSTPVPPSPTVRASDKEESDPGLIDLLKHPIKGEGTKSVVSATTTTAVQPLKIDAAKIIPESTVTETAAVVTNDNNDTNTTTTTTTTNNNNNSSNNKDDKKNLPEQIKPNNNSKVDNKSEAKAKEENKDGKIKPEDKVPEVQEVKAVVEPINVEAVVKVENGNEEKKTQEKIEETKAEQVKRSLDDADKKLKTDETDRAIEAPGSLNPLNDKRQENGSSGNNERTDQTQDKVRNHGSETSLKSSNGLSTGSVESIRSTDTGVSLNTVRGVSSAREKRGTHVVKHSQEIETLSGNVMNVESQRNGEPAIVEVTEPTVDVIQSTDNSQPGAIVTRRQRFDKWRNSVVKRLQDRWSNTKAKGKNMKCLNFGQKKKNLTQLSQINQKQEAKSAKTNKSSAWSRFKPACCRRVRSGSRIAPAETTSCCRPEKSCCFPCKPISWCRFPSCCSCKSKEITRNVRAKHSLTSVAPPPLSEEQKSKIPDVLIEHNSVMRAAIPCLPVPLAWFCLVWNVLLPGTGTLWSGLFNLCVGQPRFAATASAKSRFGAFIVNIIVGVSQAFTVLFCLVGWGWSIWWGVTMIRLARKWKRFKAAEASSNDAEAGINLDGVLPAPGVPTQTLRGMERAR